MRERVLSRAEALEEYLVYQIRLYDYLHIFRIALDIKEHSYKPAGVLDHNADYFFDTVRAISFGFFANLMDSQNHALDVFDVWRALFPEEEKSILETWTIIKPQLQLIKDYRNSVSFHINKDLRTYFEVRQRFDEARDEIVNAMQSFWDLAARLVRRQPTAMPEFRTEMEPILAKALPWLTDDERERVKDYFIQNTE